MRTGIFGGSFNPIHYGHIHLAEAAIAAGLVDEVMLLVSPQNPLKASRQLAPEAQRLAIAQKALKAYTQTAKKPAAAQRIQASDFEFSLERPTFTWHTVKALRECYPEKEFSIIIGADNWAIFHHWRHWEEILRTTPVIVYPREGSRILPRQGFPAPNILNAPLFPFSSTDIRQAIRENAPDATLAQMIPPVIIQECRDIYRSTQA